jgi:hypothetical protein
LLGIGSVLPGDSLVELLEQVNQGQEILVAEEGASSSEGHERVSRANVCPGGRQGTQVAICLVEKDAILTPGVPVGDQRKLAPMQWMEGMGYAEGFWQTAAVRRS